MRKKNQMTRGEWIFQRILRGDRPRTIRRQYKINRTRLSFIVDRERDRLLRHTLYQMNLAAIAIDRDFRRES